MRKTLTLLLLSWLLLFSSLASAGEAETLFAKGSYQEAIALLEKSKLPEEQLSLARMYFQTGKLKEALELAKKLQKTTSVATAAKTLEGEILFYQGSYADAEKLLAELVKSDITQHRAILFLGLSQKYQGKQKLSEDTFYQLFDAFEGKRAYKGKKGPKTSEFYRYVALAAAQNEAWKSANSTFQDATEMNEDDFEAWNWWGDVFLSKYNVAEAEENFDTVLKKDPNNPAANVGKARVLLEQSGDSVKPRAALAIARKSNPKYLPAMLLEARLRIDDEDYEGALSMLQEVEKINPNSLEMYALRGTVYYLTEKKKDFEKAKTTVLAIRPNYVDFFTIVCDFAIKNHRYEEVVSLAEEGLKLAPNDYMLLSLIGQNYIHLAGADRSGNAFETLGREKLERAYKGDKFNIKTVNILELYDNVIDSKYLVRTDGVFSFRYHKDEEEVLSKAVPSFLKEAYEGYAKSYKIRPAKVQIELFQEREDYAIRSVGTPDFGALGVCFGSVIAAISPSNAAFHWKQVLYHELAHTFHIELSKSRVPRWFTEGLAVYETKRFNKDWAREEDRTLKPLYDANMLLGIDTMNQGFTRAQSFAEILAAYYQSSLMVEYIDANYGFQSLVQMLTLFGKGKNSGQALKEATGLSSADFDKRFRDWLGVRFGYLASDYIAPFPKYRVNLLDEYKKEAAAKPTSFVAQLAVAYASYNAGETEEAEAALEKALQLDGKQRDALYLAAMLAGDDTRKSKLEAAIAGGADGYDARVELARIALASRDFKTAKEHLQRAHNVDPTQNEVLRELVQIAIAEKDEKGLLSLLEEYITLEQMDTVAANMLVEKAAEQKRVDLVVKYAPVALAIDPFQSKVRFLYAEALLNKEKKAKEALVEAELAMLANRALEKMTEEKEGGESKLSDKENIAVQLIAAEAALQLGDKTKAKEYASQVLLSDPSNAKAKEIAGR